MPASVPGAAEFAYPIAELEQAQRLRAAIDDLHPDAPVTVVGAGLTGIEAATELAEQGRNVTLVCGGQLGPYLSEPGRRSVAKVLRKLGVAVLETDVVTEVRPNAVVFADGAVRPSAVTIWTAGFGVPDLAAASGLRTDAMGRLLTDETLTSVDDPRIVAAGDCASPSGVPLRMSCQSASPLGRAGGQHRAEPGRRHRACGHRPGVRRSLHQPGPQVGHPAVRPQGRHGGEPVLQLAVSSPRSRRRSARARCGRCAARRPSRVRRSGSRAARGPSSRCSRRRWSRKRDHHRARHAERFTHLRPLLFTIVYEILGSATESDDVLQDSYLRWADVDLATVRDTKSYLAQLVTRQALNALRAGARRREEYIGPWLPEPLLLDERDASADVVLAESVSMAMLVLLETLTPDERAVFVLREVFGFDYDEIAGAVGKSAAAVRQMAHRAREHVHARRKRFGPVDTERTTQITEQFLTAASTGDMDGLLALLAPGATWTADHGGKATALPRPLVGARKVAGVMVALFQAARRRDIRFEMAVYNSAPAVVVYDGDKLEGVFVFEVIDDVITNLYAMRNPDKLAGDHDPAGDQPLVTSTTPGASCHTPDVGGVLRADWLNEEQDDSRRRA